MSSTVSRHTTDRYFAVEEGARGGVAHTVDSFVDGAFFFDIEIGARDIGFRLVIIVIGDEIFHRIIGEEGFELAVKLGGESLVVGEDQGGALGGLDDLGHCEGLACARRAEENLIPLALLEALDEFRDGGDLIAGGGIFAFDTERLASVEADPVAIRAVRGPVIRGQRAGGVLRGTIHFKGGRGFFDSLWHG